MLIRPATDDDVDELCRLRIAFIADVRAVDPATFDPAFVDATRAFVRSVVEQDRIRSWLAERDGALVGVVSVLLTDRPPLPEYPQDRDGYIVNMYVVPKARRQGIARALIDTALGAAQELGLRGFLLHATEQARPLYESLGFANDPRFLYRPAEGPNQAVSGVDRSTLQQRVQHLPPIDHDQFRADLDGVIDQSL